MSTLIEEARTVADLISDAKIFLHEDGTEAMVVTENEATVSFISIISHRSEDSAYYELFAVKDDIFIKEDCQPGEHHECKSDECFGETFTNMDDHDETMIVHDSKYESGFFFPKSARLMRAACEDASWNSGYDI